MQSALLTAPPPPPVDPGAHPGTHSLTLRAVALAPSKTISTAATRPTPGLAPSRSCSLVRAHALPLRVRLPPPSTLCALHGPHPTPNQQPVDHCVPMPPRSDRCVKGTGRMRMLGPTWNNERSFQPAGFPGALFGASTDWNWSGDFEKQSLSRWAREPLGTPGRPQMLDRSGCGWCRNFSSGASVFANLCSSKGHPMQAHAVWADGTTWPVFTHTEMAYLSLSLSPPPSMPHRSLHPSRRDGLSFSLFPHTHTHSLSLCVCVSRCLSVSLRSCRTSLHVLLCCANTVHFRHAG